MKNFTKKELIEWNQFVLQDSKNEIVRHRSKIKTLSIITIILAIASIPLHLFCHILLLSFAPIIVSFLLYYFIKEKLDMKIATYNVVHIYTQRDLNKLLGIEGINTQAMSEVLEIEEALIDHVERSIK